MTSTMKLRVPLASSLGWLVTIGLLVAWWLTLAPTAIGGPATYVLVEGHSMEPMFHIGDLAIARQEPSYAVGDVIVMNVHQGDRDGLIIHRLYSGDAANEWQTKGDHNPVPDAFTISTSQIQGRYWFGIPGFGFALQWVTQHYVAFAGFCAALGLLLYVPWHRRRIPQPLSVAMATADAEHRSVRASPGEYAVLAISSLAAFASMGLVGVLAIRHELATARGLVSFAALIWAGAFTVYFVYRLFDGRGLAEPAKSVAALTGRLFLVTEFPALDEDVTSVASAVALRSIAEKYRMPVLHRIDVDTGRHEFLLITAQHGAFRWSPQPVGVVAASGAGDDQPGGDKRESGRPDDADELVGA